MSVVETTPAGAAPESPDFYRYEPDPLAAVTLDANTVSLSWSDGSRVAVNGTWLRENSVGHGIDPVTREGIGDPDQLRRHRPTAVSIVGGDLRVGWDDGFTHVYPSGWLRSFADGVQQAASGLPAPVAWVTDRAGAEVSGERRADLPTFPWPLDPTGAELRDIVTDLVRYGAIRLTAGPTDPDALESFIRRFSALRDTNFGHVWDVVARVDPDSTAYTGLPLVPHTDLPTRESPPGFQALHCIENSCEGGLNQMSDGLALAYWFQQHEPNVYQALTTLEWVFQSKGKAIDHRWTAPLLSWSTDGSLIIRGFSPVRAYPAMPPGDIDRSYAAIARLHQLAADSAFQIQSTFVPGDAVIFDNRRMLHARSGFDPTAGTRHLRGCYFDADNVRSTLRVLTRRNGA